MFKFISLIVFILFLGCSSQDARITSEQYKYDSNGRLISKITLNGKRIDFKYNDLGILAEVNYPDNKLEYGYDKKGNRIWIKDKTGITRYCYDSFNRIIGIIWKHSPLRLIKYEYDKDDVSAISIYILDLINEEPSYQELVNLLKRDIQLGKLDYDYNENFIDLLNLIDKENSQKKESWLDYDVKYNRDLLGNIIDVDTKWGKINYFYYPDKGTVERQLPNGINSRYIYNSDGLLTSLHHENKEGRLIAEYNYNYNASGLITKVFEQTSESSKTFEYAWNSRGYLKELILPDGSSIRYDYDEMGNRILKEDNNVTLQYNYDNFGRLTNAGNYSYKCDRNGNLISQKSDRLITNFRYDMRDLVSLITTQNGTIKYNWDGDGNLISRQQKDEITHYLPNPIDPSGNTLVEYDNSGKLINSYLYGEGLAGQVDNDGQISFFLEDGFSSIRYKTGTDGSIKGNRDFSPFGELLMQKGENVTNFRMMGERFIPEIKSYVINGRIYNPELGRYFTPHPMAGNMERFDSFNKYTSGGGGGGVGGGGFTEPRCNQTSLVSTIGNDIIKWGILESVKGFSRMALKEAFADLGRQWGPLFEWGYGNQGYKVGGIVGEKVADLVSFFSVTGKLITSEIDRRMSSTPNYSGSLFGLTGDFWEQWGREGLAMMGGGMGKSFGPVGSIAGKVAARVVGEITARIFTFYGTRMDRPYWWWSPMKWISLEEYLIRQRQEDLGININDRKSTQSSEEGEKREEDDDDRKYPLSNSKPFGGGPPGGPPGGGGEPPGGGGGGPPGGGGGSPGGGVGFPGSYFSKEYIDPFKSLENQIGGIKIAATADFIGNIGNITGAVYDPDKQCIVLVGERNISLPEMKAEDLAVAFVSVFGTSPCDLQFSLDPADPQNPRGRWLKAVYMPENILAGTAFGRTMFEADWLLKQYSFGVRFDENGEILERLSSVPGFRSTSDLMFESTKDFTREESWTRLWIEADDHDSDLYHNMTLELSADGNSINYAIADLAILTKKQVPDPNSPSGLSDVETEEDPISTEFAKLFTELYDDISKESPEFGRIKQLLKIVALAKWLKKENIPFTREWITENYNKRDSSIARISALSISKHKKTQHQNSISTYEIHLFGGVNGGVNPKFIRDNGMSKKYQTAVKANLNDPNAGPIFTLNIDGDILQAVVLPITTNGEKLWEGSPSILMNGTFYQFNSNRLITKEIDQNGTVTNYSYNSNGVLSDVEIDDPFGFKMAGKKNDQESIWTVENAKGDILKYTYGNSGYLNDIRVNDEVLASYKIDEELRQVVTQYKDYKGIRTYSKNGNIKKYEIQNVSDETNPNTEDLVFQYDDLGYLIEINGTNTSGTYISYDKVNNFITEVKTPLSKMQYQYDTNGQIKEIIYSNGSVVNYSYKDNMIHELSVKKEGENAEYLFGEDGLIQSKDFLGGTFNYNYKNGNLTSVKQEGNEASYKYDEQNRLTEIHFPNGSWIEYQYSEEGIKSKEVDSGNYKTLTILYHGSVPR